jgi:hypothetical protein
MLTAAIYYVLSPAALFAQLPGWITYTDPDDNTYYIDKNAKIWVSGEPEHHFQAVSLQGIEFYAEQGVALIRNHHKVEGLTLLKAVRVLADKRQQAYHAGVKAAQVINQLVKSEGDRFARLNDAASLLLVNLGDHIYVYNDRMRYGLTIPGSVEVVKRRLRYRHNYLRYGVMLGVNITSQAKSTDVRFDFLLLINSEEFHYTLPAVATYKKLCMNKLSGDSFTRKVIGQDQKHIIYFFEDRNSKSIHRYQGYEAFFIKKRRGYFMRIIGERKKIIRYKARLEKIIEQIALH